MSEKTIRSFLEVQGTVLGRGFIFTIRTPTGNCYMEMDGFKLAIFWRFRFVWGRISGPEDKLTTYALVGARVIYKDIPCGACKGTLFFTPKGQPPSVHECVNCGKQYRDGR